jgi:hypothetical protein
MRRQVRLLAPIVDHDWLVNPWNISTKKAVGTRGMNELPRPQGCRRDGS